MRTSATPHHHSSISAHATKEVRDDLGRLRERPEDYAAKDESEAVEAYLAPAYEPNPMLNPRSAGTELT